MVQDRTQAAGPRTTTGTRWKNLSPERQAQLQEAACEANRRRADARHVAALVARAGRLAPEQLAALRSLLPAPSEPEADDQQAAS